MGWLTRSDADAVIAFAAESAAVPGDDRFWIVERLLAMIPADGIFYSHMATGTSAVLHQLSTVTPRATSGPGGTLPGAQGDENPFCAHFQRVRAAGAIRLTDLTSPAAFAASALGRLLQWHPTLHSMQLRVAVDAQMHVCVDLERTGRDFSHRERELLSTLGPHVIGYERTLSLMAALGRIGGIQPPAAAASVLTAREDQVLDLLASGYSTAMIARRLQCSPQTIRKHLEHAYAKLGVHSRTAALARTGRSGARAAPGDDAVAPG